MQKAESGWHVYRTRFLIRAKQLTEPLEFRDVLGREHSGQPGDYLIESSDGTQRIARREIFEDIYVVMTSSARKKRKISNPIIAGRAITSTSNSQRGSIPLAKTEIQYMGISLDSPYIRE